MPAAEARELAHELRVRLAHDRDLDDRPFGSHETPVDDGAETGDELVEPAQGRVTIKSGPGAKVAP